MRKMGRYCKAYPIERFAEYAAWPGDVDQVRKQQRAENKTEADSLPDFLYLQEDFTVTDGIFLDENVIFGNVTPEWVAFCKNTLAFEIPEYQRAEATSSAGANTETAGA